MKLNSYLIIGAVLALLAGTAVVRYICYIPVPPPEHILIYDQSNSKIDGCVCLKQEARSKISNARFNKEIISFYALGTAETGYKPKPVASYEIPKNDSVYKDKDKEKEQIENLLTDLESKCKSIPRTDVTPLFQAMNTAVEQLKKKCSVESKCSIYAQTDLEESIDPQLLAAFKASKSGKESVNLKTIDNSAILITFAGISELVVSQVKQQKNKDKALDKMRDGETWQKLWMQTFTQSNLIEFKPICSLSQQNLALLR